MDNKDSWKITNYLAGGAVGLMTGLAAAHLFNRTAEETNTEGDNVATKVEPADMFKIGLALVALVRQVSDLAARREGHH
jgi:hypothetical protein